MTEQIPVTGEMTVRGLVTHVDGRVARVTMRGRVWGYWENGRRSEPFDTEWDAARAFFATNEALSASDSVAVDVNTRVPRRPT